MYTIFIEVVQNCVTMAFVLDFVFLNYTDAYFLWNKNKIYFIFLYLILDKFMYNVYLHMYILIKQKFLKI